MLARIGRGVARRIKGVVQSATGFSHTAAQVYETEYARGAIKQNFANLYAQFEAEKGRGGLWQSANDQWFQGDTALFDEFVDHVRERKTLEVGSGPFGHIAPCYWMKDRVIVDPLVDFYRDEQIKLTGRTFFTDELARYSAPAEQPIPELVGKVSGAIISRNALDHCEDPMTVLLTLSRYAVPGCWFLLWTDIWHLAGLDDGHQNITKSHDAMDAYLSGLGFDIVKRGTTIRDPNEYLEYGVIARKR